MEVPDYQVGARFKALDEGVLIAAFKSTGYFFPISISLKVQCLVPKRDFKRKSKNNWKQEKARQILMWPTVFQKDEIAMRAQEIERKEGRKIELIRTLYRQVFSSAYHCRETFTLQKKCFENWVLILTKLSFRTRKKLRLQKSLVNQKLTWRHNSDTMIP